MANNEIIKRIDAAVSRLCNSLQAIYTNLFDRDRENQLQRSTSHLINPRRIIPTGTYACGVWEAGEDVHLICIGNNSAEIFWSLLKERLCLDVDTKLPSKYERATIELSAARLARKTDASKCCLHEFVDLSLMDKAGCKFYLHYAESEKVFIDHILTNPIPFPSVNSQTTPAVCNAIIVRDIEMVARDTSGCNPDLISLIQALRKWAHSRGLIGAKFGFLDSNDLVWLAHSTVVPEQADDSSESEVSVESDVAINLETAFDRLTSHIGSQPSSKNGEASKLQCKTICEERMVRHLSFEAKEAILKADPRSKSTDPWKLTRPKDAQHDRFLKVEADCWAPMLDNRADFQDNVVPRNVNKLVEALRHATHSLRIWPTPIVHTHDQTKQVYAIGINFSENFAIDLNDHVDYPLDYDQTVGLINVTGASREDFDRIAADAAKVQTTSNGSNDPDPRVALASSSMSTKFRMAHAAISRLKYDPKHMGEKYEVGYEDRFMKDLMWMPLEEWGGKAIEDENFIPEHRVRLLRRSKDKRIVWNRANRIDLT